ncbi:MAG: M48 family metalloprotease [Gemmatimonadetes bacterium]|nr:M48 family metalloprotease [Gemmatimonadota bacterium]
MGIPSSRWRSAAPAVVLGAAVACAVSVQREIQLGADYAAEIDRTMPVVHDAAVQAALDQAVRPVLAVAVRRDLPWTFRVVNTADVNAFAVPGGHIYVTRGLIEHTTSYDQLAGVLGHEIGHVDLRHSASHMEKAQAASLGVNLGYILLGRQPGQTESTALNIAASVIFAKFSRDDEREADHAAVRYLTRTGINPGGMTDMFNILRQLEGRQPDAIAQFFASHPMTDDRITDVGRMIAADTAAQRAVHTGVRDRPVFHDLRRAVRALPPPPIPAHQPGRE